MTDAFQQDLCDLGEADNAPALQARIDWLAAQGGGVIHLPAARRHYKTGPLVWRNGVSLVGVGPRLSRVQGLPDALRPLIDVTGVDGAVFQDIALLGDGAVPGGWASGIYSDGPSRNITVARCAIADWTRHGVSLDGVSGLDVIGCCIERCHAGGGVIVSRGQGSSDIMVRDCRISQTQFGNIHAWGPVERVTVTGNHLHTSGWQGGTYASGNVADNITLYGPATNRDIVIRGNLCAAAAENGIHAAGSGLIIEGNTIRTPALYGIIVSNRPHDRPAPCHQVVVANNTILCPDPDHAESRGIGLRNCLDFSVTGNQIAGANMGIELLGRHHPTGRGSIVHNVLSGGGALALRLRGLTAPVDVHGNLWNMQFLCDPDDPPSEFVLLGHNPRG